VRWRFGQVTPIAIGATAFIVLTSSIALIAFHYSVHPGMRGYGAMLPVEALGGVSAAAILFPLLNAVLEEAVFRGVFFDAAEPQWGRWGAIVITAALFGYAHRQGYPPGLFGAFLAGLYGLAMGWLRVLTGGIGLPIIAHIFADATIFTVMVRSGCFAD
jgi:membrane protease YdiL (CAAX protease family)